MADVPAEVINNQNHIARAKAGGSGHPLVRAELRGIKQARIVGSAAAPLLHGEVCLHVEMDDGTDVVVVELQVVVGGQQKCVIAIWGGRAGRGRAGGRRRRRRRQWFLPVVTADALDAVTARLGSHTTGI